MNGQNIRISHFNALGDMATANAIAKQVTNGNYEMVVTATTPYCRRWPITTRAAKPSSVRLVADPFVAGVGLDRDHPDRHPAYLTGIGTFLPVEDSFKLAREFFPALKSLGIVWNPSEANSASYL